MTVAQAQSPNRSTGRIGIVIVLIASIVLSGIAREWARAMRTRPGDIASGNSSNASLASMNSFALALLLGGLRGPLVMFLWINSENLKNEKNLEDFDTYVELIRLLQPEFDTVHIFQVWNKAYNISVQMADVSNKYTTILDALDYATRVVESRPNNMSLIYQIASIYFDKLGNSSEKAYYRERVRKESRPHASRQKLARGDPGWRRLELDPVVDASGYILPALLKPKYARPANLPANSPWNNGAELQYLEPYQPFPYGVGTFAFAYNYHKQAQVLQEVAKQVHANLSQTVVDSRPALALKGWSEDEWERGRRLEAKAMNVAAPDERRELEVPSASTAVDAPLSDKSLLEPAIYSYELGARLSRDALAEYERHLLTNAQNWQTYQSHMDSIKAQEPLLTGDAEYLRAMQTSGADRQKHLDAASAAYRKAMRGNLEIIFKYYMPDPVAKQALPAEATKSDLSKITDDQIGPLYEKTMGTLEAWRQSDPRNNYDPDQEDRSDYQRYVERAAIRLKQIGTKR